MHRIRFRPKGQEVVVCRGYDSDPSTEARSRSKHKGHWRTGWGTRGARSTASAAPQTAAAGGRSVRARRRSRPAARRGCRGSPARAQAHKARRPAAGAPPTRGAKRPRRLAVEKDVARSNCLATWWRAAVREWRMSSRAAQQVAQPLLLDARRTHEHQLAGVGEPHQLRGVAAVGLDAITVQTEPATARSRRTPRRARSAADTAQSRRAPSHRRPANPSAPPSRSMNRRTAH